MEKYDLNTERIASSFRDPSGFLFRSGGYIYRQINLSYKNNYDFLLKSGLYEYLVKIGLLIPHKEIEPQSFNQGGYYKIIKPEQLDFVSYPYEWCFSQVKDAALTTLKIQKEAFNRGMSLKDSSAYNIQFVKCRPLLIDTLSFEIYNEGRPWVAYKQFCQHFLAPLALMSYRDIRLNQLSRIYIDGVPLNLASSLLPFSTCLNFSLLAHIHLHSKAQGYFSDKKINRYKKNISRLSFMGLIDSLESIVKSLKWKAEGTQWANYYKDNNYSETAFQDKKAIVAKYLDQLNSKNIWDIGANDGLFSRIASDKGLNIISFDIDPAAVEINYKQCIASGYDKILPLLMDFTNPSPGIGWENDERVSLLKRGMADTALALALIHHLAISNNLPFLKIAGFFNKICNSLIIEFIPKSDSQVQKLLLSREDIFTGYNQQAFEEAFNKFFKIRSRITIKNSDRVLYLMSKF